jgi:hypothetical protein
MSFSEVEGMLRWECDKCGIGVELSATKHDFGAWWRALKRVGWTAVRDEAEWYHYCQRCVRRQKGEAKEIMSRRVK